MQHGSRSSNYRSVLPFCHSILLRSVWYCQLSLNALLYAILVELLGGILTPVIWFEYLNLPPNLVLHKSFELLEPLQDLLRFLAPYKVDPGLPGMVIDECHIILKTSQRNKWHRTTQVRMYQIKYSCWLAITACKSSLGVLSQSTPLAYITVLSAELRKPCNHVPQHPQSWMMQMSHPHVPQLAKLVVAAMCQSMLGLK